jgi:hypothetical protein
MSVEALGWALAQAPNVQPLCVAAPVGLANHAGSDGTNGYLAVAQLTGYARKSERSILRDLKQLRGLVVEGGQRYVAYLPADRRATVYNLAVWVRREVEVPTWPVSGMPSRCGQRPPLRWPLVLAEVLPLVEGPSPCAAASRAGGCCCGGRRRAVRITDCRARPGNARRSHVRVASVASGCCRSVSAAVVASVTLRLFAVGRCVAVAGAL